MKKYAIYGKLSRGFRKGYRYITLIFLTLLCIFPFYLLLVNATRAHVDIQRGFSILPGKSLVMNVVNVLGNETILIVRGMLNSALVSTLTVVLSVYFSVMTAYAIHAYDFKLKKAAFHFILLVMTIPTQVSALGFVKMITAMNLKDSFVPLIIPAIVAPSCVFFMKQYMDSALPLDIIEAARIDGSGEFRTFNKLVLPIMKPAIAVQAIFTFVGSWNNYFIPALIIDDPTKRTLPIVIALIRSTDYARFDMGAIYMAIGISILPVALVYLILSKFIIRGIALGAVKG